MKMDFIYGMTQGFLAPPGYYYTEEAVKSVERMKAHGVNLVALVVNQFLENFHSTRIFALSNRTQGDEELGLHIARLHEAGIRVMLKPMIDPLDSDWRGNIHQYRGCKIFADIESDTVTPWFDSYRHFLNHYAELAEKNGCELFCSGCELDGMEGHTDEWHETIRQVRERYHGTVIYNSTMDLKIRDNRKWMEDVDIVGFSGYFHVGPADRTSSLEEMRQGWLPWMEKLKAYAEWIGKPLMFAETGTRPLVGAAGITGGFNTTSPIYSEEEQADYYTATLDVLDKEDWFCGSIWWKLDEFQYRPNYYLADGHYVGCEPTETLRQTMKLRSARKLIREI